MLKLVSVKATPYGEYQAHMQRFNQEILSIDNTQRQEIEAVYSKLIKNNFTYSTFNKDCFMLFLSKIQYHQILIEGTQIKNTQSGLTVVFKSSPNTELGIYVQAVERDTDSLCTIEGASTTAKSSAVQGLNGIIFLKRITDSITMTQTGEIIQGKQSIGCKGLSKITFLLHSKLFLTIYGVADRIDIIRSDKLSSMHFSDNGAISIAFIRSFNESDPAGITYNGDVTTQYPNGVLIIGHLLGFVYQKNSRIIYNDGAAQKILNDKTDLLKFDFEKYTTKPPQTKKGSKRPPQVVTGQVVTGYVNYKEIEDFCKYPFLLLAQLLRSEFPGFSTLMNENQVLSTRQATSSTRRQE